MRGLILLAIGLAVLAPPAQAAPAPRAKLDSHLQDLLAGRAPARGGLRESAVPTTGDRVLVDVYATGDLDAAASALRGLGMRVAAIGRRAPQRLVEGELPVAALLPAARLGGTRAVMAVLGSGTNVGSVTSEGDARHHGPQARALGVSGNGVTVGIVSDSINRKSGGIAASQATGDLPADVQVLQDGPTTGSDEGRAMAEIVYDEAPGLHRVLFSTGSGAATRAAGIDNLVANGATVIADDTFQITEPFFQDGQVAQAIDRARAAGVVYAISAGNRARQSWEGSYRPTGSPESNDFDPGTAVDTVQTLGTFTDRRMFVSLQWDEPWTQASTDLALDVYSISGGTPTPAFTVNSDNLATGLPSEFASINITGTVTVGIGIRRLAGTRAPFMKYIVGGTPAFTIAEHNVPTAGAVDPDGSSARGALTVGAVDQADAASDTPESFSSRGPALKLFDAVGDRLPGPELRLKPEIAGADGVSTSVPGFRPFSGTSAAAPAIAGVATLIRSANPSLSAEGVTAILLDASHNIDCTESGGLPDLDCGFGFSLADGAVAQALDASPPAITPSVNGPAALGGFFTGDVSVSWAVGDGESPVFASSGCDPAGVTGDVITTMTCTATSAGGTATQSVTIKRDASPPSSPAIAGIEARTYVQTKVPPAAGISCTASDPTSGLASCGVIGYSRAPGAHTLTATAVNGAGLTSTATLIYTVKDVAPALSGLQVRGTKTVRFKLSEPAKVTFTVARCKGKKCTTVGKFTQQGEAGANQKTLPKKVGGKRLKRGQYRVTLRAKDATGHRSKARSATVTVR